MASRVFKNRSDLFAGAGLRGARGWRLFFSLFRSVGRQNARLTRHEHDTF